MTYKTLKNMNKTNFGYFLAGLIDADGYIRSGELALTLADTDKAMGRSLIKIFGGRMRPSKARRAFNYELNNRASLIRVADLIRHKLVLDYRRNQYNTHWVPNVNVPKTKARRFDLRRNAWLSGFTFGDGSLQIKLSRRRTYTYEPLRCQLMLQFSMQQKAKPALAKIQAAFGGSVYPRKGTENANYSSGGLKAAEKLKAYYDAYPLYFRHRRIYILWREAYTILASRHHLKSAGMERLRVLQTQVSALRPKKDRF